MFERPEYRLPGVGQLNRDDVEWALIFGPPERCSGMKDLTPSERRLVLLEASFLQGLDELIPVMPAGVTRVNGKFVVSGSHGGGTVKVTERFDR